MIYDIMALHLTDIEILINHSAPRKLQLIEQNFYQQFASSINYICLMQGSLLTNLPGSLYRFLFVKVLIGTFNKVFRALWKFAKVCWQL